MNVVIFGCGPAGLFAAHAATRLGCDVTIYSKPRKSFMRGAQYLHRPIPGLSRNPFQVTYDLLGTVEGYREKVYGDMGDILVSPETLTGTSDAWDIREAYDGAWELYKDLIVPFDFEAQKLPKNDGDLFISTIPAPLLCRRDHSFVSQEVWVTDMIKPSGQFLYEDGGLVDNLVICSGDPDDWWYRASRIHGFENTEYPLDREPKSSYEYGRWLVEKPISTDCDCYIDIVRLGRYGAWKKGILSDAAYYDTEALIQMAKVGL